MIKYSLQNECLENIEAFTDEQISREMAVIESVLEIYNKTILMMELSNSDVDLPDCSMFMESTFFQEEVEGGAPATAVDTPKEGQPAQGDGKDKSGETKKPMTEEERKAYNKEHWVRMKTKDGKTENIFISIIAFIPRLLGYLIQCVVRFFKKLFNKKADDTVKKGSKAAQNKTTDELKKDLSDSADSGGETSTGEGGAVEGGGASEAPKVPTAGKMDTKTKMWNWYDVTPILNAIESIDKVLQSLSTANMDAIGEFGKTLSDEKQKLDNALTGRVQMDGDRVVDSKNNLLNKLNGLKASAENAEKSIQEFVESKRSGHGASRNDNVQNARSIVTTLKNVIKSLTTIMTAVGQAYGKTYEEASKILKNAGARDIGEVQNTDSSQPPVNTEGGENNG